METLFNNYINKQINKEDEELVEPQRRKVPYKFDDDLANKYVQSLVVNKSFILLKRNQKYIKLTSELNRYYNTGLKFIKICFDDSNKQNNVISNPLNW